MINCAPSGGIRHAKRELRPRLDTTPVIRERSKPAQGRHTIFGVYHRIESDTSALSHHLAFPSLLSIPRNENERLELY